MRPGKPKTPLKPPAAPTDGWSGFTRRAFIKSWGAGTLTLAVGRNAVSSQTTPEDATLAGDEMVQLTLDVNGRPHAVLAEPRWTLLHVLREELGLTAAKTGCERGECGSCTVLIDNLPRYACLTLAVEAEGRHIETAEGLMDGSRPGQVQISFMQEDGLQCGYCTPGQIMAAEGLLRHNAAPSFDEIRRGMSGNLCRCGAYTNIFNAVADAARSLSDLSDRSEQGGRVEPFFRSFEENSRSYLTKRIGKMDRAPTGAVDQPQVRQAPRHRKG